MNRPTPGKRRLHVLPDRQVESHRGGDTDPRTRDLDPLCRLWALRAMVELGAIDDLCRGDAFAAPQLLTFVGVQPRTTDGDPDDLFAEFDRKDVLRKARQRLREQSAPGVATLPETSIAARHLAWLRAELGLTELQAQVLLLCALGDLSTLHLCSVLATVLGASVEAVSQALDRNGTLAASGLARVDHNGQYEFPAKIDLLHGVSERLLTDHSDRFRLFADNFVMAGVPRLGCERFGHLGGRLAHLKAYLGQAVRAGTAGVNVLVYGPPGTGKSAFAQHLARELGLPAMLQRASDILSAFVGETEQQMAAMFRRARDEGAVLILDEADTFLAERQGARQRWEISAVNEMLTQMEAFEGLFVATTNLIDRLDEASLRRFDAKICFDYLRPPQVAALLRQACAGLGLDAAGCDEAATRLHKLTPGDFAAVMRQARFRPVHSLAELGTRLADEVAHKRGGGSGRPMGFRSVA